MHWPVPAPALRALVPAPLNIHKFHGVAWIAIAPFWTSGLEHRWITRLYRAPMAALSVHTFVVRNGRPGIWFLQLSAGDRLSAWLGSYFLGLPFLPARGYVERGVGLVTQRWERNGKVVFEAHYSPAGKAMMPSSGTLEHWLTERYALYTTGPSGELRQTEIHHARWPVQPAAVTLHHNEVLASLGLQYPWPRGPVLHTPRMEIVAWPSRPVLTIPQGTRIRRERATRPSTTASAQAGPGPVPEPAPPADLPVPAETAPAAVS